MEYSFEEFIQDVNMGREIELIYNNEMYFITYNKLIKCNDNTSQCFNNEDELLKNAEIDGYKLKELWDRIEIGIIY